MSVFKSVHPREVDAVRASILVLIILLIAAAPALAKDQKPAMDLPVYPGSETTMEVDLSAEDIPPMLQAAIPMLAGSKPGLAELLKPDELTEILKDVKRVEFLQLETKSKNTTLQQITDYYAKNLPAGKWSRVYFTSVSGSTTAVYANPDQQTYFGVRAQTRSVDGRQVKQINVAKLVGKIDFARLIDIAAKAFTAQAASAK
jgi:hypothetical protein